MKPEKTGFCWGCGGETKKIYCSSKCERDYKRSMAQADKMQIRRGKREGYGVGGSTH